MGFLKDFFTNVLHEEAASRSRQSSFEHLSQEELEAQKQAEEEAKQREEQERADRQAAEQEGLEQDESTYGPGPHPLGH